MIRMAVRADERAIRACAERAYAPYVETIGRRPAPMDADYAGQIDRGLVHVAITASGILEGFIVFEPRGDHMFLENVAVRPEVAGHGTGRALVAFCEAEAARLGLGAVHLYTNARMTANLSLYPHLGYVETERRQEDGFDRVYCRKRLG